MCVFVWAIAIIKRSIDAQKSNCSLV